MSGGELRDYIQIESLINAVSANGDYSAGKTWGIVAKVWAKIKYMQGSENSDERDATIGKAMIKIRWRDDISNKMRITFGSRVFDIEDNFDLTGRNQYLTLHTIIADGPPATEATFMTSIFTDITGVSAVYTELLGDVDGVNTTFTVSNTSYKAGSLVVNWGGVTQYGVVETNPGTGIFDLDFAPATGTQVMAQYEI